jgi:A/G-specific adenine glycosylase
VSGPPAGLRRAVTRRLLPWFARHRRDLPWRRNRSPYRVWVSELMLQQTRVDTVIPYFRRFMTRFPSVSRLAAAPLPEVLKAWEGLGYYSRARNLHRAARRVVEEFGGDFPKTRAGWLELPGVGPYTAAAVASLAFGLDHAVLDGNVERVLSRCLALDMPSGSSAAKRRLQGAADALLPPGRAGEFNEALMELGAVLCLPRAPACPRCPLRGECAAARAGTPERWPVRRPGKPLPLVRVAAAAVRRRDGRILVARRPEHGLLAGLWEFPGGKIRAGETPRECAARELREELGVTIAPGELLDARAARLQSLQARHGGLLGHPRVRPPARDRVRGLCLGADRLKWIAIAFSRADLKVIEAIRAAGRGAAAMKAQVTNQRPRHRAYPGPPAGSRPFPPRPCTDWVPTPSTAAPSPASSGSRAVPPTTR